MQQPVGRNDLATILQLLVTGLGLIVSLVAAFFLAAFGLAGILGEVVPLDQAEPLFFMAWVAALMAVLALPSLAYSLMRVMNREPRWLSTRGPFGFGSASLLFLLWPFVLLLGSQLQTIQQVAWLVMPPLQILAIGIPVWWLIEVARRKLPIRSPKRGWGIFNITMFVSTPTAIIVELGVLLLLAVLFIAAISLRPEWLQAVQQLAMRLNGNPDPQELMTLLRPLLRNPFTVYGGMALIAGVIPMLEELIKPIALWPLAGRQITPAEGFAAGALCGGAFALLESLLNLATPLAEGWAGLMVGRSGTALLHITTTALMGWSLAYVWRHGTYIRLGVGYLLAAALHGMWNALSILPALDVVLENPPQSMQWLMRVAAIAPFGIAVLVIILFLLLWGGNQILRRQPEAPYSPTPSSD